MREALASQAGSVAQLGQLLEGSPEGLIPLPIGRVPSAASLKGKGSSTSVSSLTQMAASTFMPLLPPAAEDLLSLGGEDGDAAAMVAAKSFYTEPSRKRDSAGASSRDQSSPRIPIPSPVGPAEEEALRSKSGQIQPAVNASPSVGTVESSGLTQGEIITRE